MAAYADFDQIYPNLFQGSYPKLTRELLQHFDVVVYCAMEKQPKTENLKLVTPDKHVIGIPLDDDPYQPVTRDQAATIFKLARQLAQHVRSGRRVLITCWMGMNRSGIVSALTLMMISGCTGKGAATAVQTRRRAAPDGMRALSNPMFARFVETLPPVL